MNVVVHSLTDKHIDKLIMEATYRINLDELTPEFISALKTTFQGNAQNVELSLRLDFTPANAELLRSMHNIEQGENLVRFNGDQFGAFVERYSQ
jgi:hypothetical protein